MKLKFKKKLRKTIANKKLLSKVTKLNKATHTNQSKVKLLNRNNLKRQIRTQPKQRDYKNRKQKQKALTAALIRVIRLIQIKSRRNNTNQKSNNLSKMTKLIEKTKVKPKVSPNRSTLAHRLFMIRSNHRRKVVASQGNHNHKHSNSSLRQKISLLSQNYQNRLLHSQKLVRLKNLTPTKVCSRAYMVVGFLLHLNLRNNPKVFMLKLLIRRNRILHSQN